ncbi:MAG: hypothetical protein ACI8Y7_000082 [Candidatus Woesearchaeota archaeon]|jgi:hypothetical protein
MKNTISTKGFTKLSKEQVHIKKLIAHYAATYELKRGGFDELHVVRKDIHKTVNSTVHNIKVNMYIGGKLFHAESEDYDVLVALDDAFTSVDTAMS